MAEAFALGATESKLRDIIHNRERDIASCWIEKQSKALSRLPAPELQQAARQSREFLSLLRTALTHGTDSLSGPAWQPVRDFLGDLSSGRAKSGYSPTETAIFIFSLKEPLFEVLTETHGSNAAALAADLWRTTEMIDSLGLWTAEAFLKTREQIIVRQQQEMMELSTPVVQLWDGILALPLIGTLDSSRTQIVMENLLDAIVKTRSDFAIIDITGVPVVDTLVAQHLLKTISAARLMGAECVISGIRPQIAQTIIHLGVDLASVVTKATLADAFRVVLKRGGSTIARTAGASPAAASLEG